VNWPAWASATSRWRPSSHGIDQRRLDGVQITAAGFTNFTQDHLDYHKSMEAYRAAKLRLFDQLLPRGRTAVLNADSEGYGAFSAAAIVNGQTILSVGERGQGLTLVGRTLSGDGQRLTVEADGRRHRVRLPLAGAFQVSNALVAAGLCVAAGEDAARRDRRP
jgi:UDP-N-acetylmuramoyl-L-alanyl-D-glutamate--2,6-diaminopimelate ligase